MATRSRREFLSDVGRGMVIASVGAAAAADLGLARGLAAEPAERLRFGSLDPLVNLLQETPSDRLLPVLSEKLKAGVSLKTLLAAGTLANARAFGGEDYVGFHTMMALAPSWYMAQELPAERQPLPVFKVLYRNTSRIHERGAKEDTLHPVAGTPTPQAEVQTALFDAMRSKDMDAAEKAFAGAASGPAEDAFNTVLPMVHDSLEVHRIVLPYRAWDVSGLVGREHAHLLLRQSVHYCVKAERNDYNKRFTEARTLLPKLMDRHDLMTRKLGTREVDDAWVDRMSQTIFRSTPAQAAEAVASALAEGISPEALGEALSLAANQLVLRDKGRPANQASAGKPIGSVHGDSIGVHASDSANAWRNIAGASNTRNAHASLILGAYQVAFDRTERGGDFLNWEPYPLKMHQTGVKESSEKDLLRALDEAIRANDQGRACAVVARCGELNMPAKPIFALLCGFAISEDGALHGEKYYRTVVEDFTASRPAFRWRHLTGLARVTASEYGRPAPGYAQARELLGV